MRWEWTTALEAGPRLAFQIHPLGSANAAPIPPELAHLHFGDLLMDLRQAAER